MQGETVQIFDDNALLVSAFVDGVATATVEAGNIYVIIFESQATDRIYTIRSSAGPGALSNAPPTNILSPTDTTANGATTALDALVIINALNRMSIAEGEQLEGSLTFLDVNRDSKVTAADALMVISELNRQRQLLLGRSGSGEQFPLPLPSLSKQADADGNAAAADAIFGDPTSKLGDDFLEKISAPASLPQASEIDDAYKSDDLDLDPSLAFSLGLLSGLV